MMALTKSALLKAGAATTTPPTLTLVSTKVSKKRKRGFRLTMPKKKKKVVEYFDAFKNEPAAQAGHEIAGPQEGIHSLAWAQIIVPQRGLFSLPIEVRNKIYGYVFGDNPNYSIKPKKAKKKFTNIAKPSNTLTQTYTTLSQLCRQSYVDTTGSGVIYALGAFHFVSPLTMTNYLSVINPFHRTLVRTISLRIRITSTRPTISTPALRTLASLPSLQNLHVEFDVISDMCTLISWRWARPRKFQVKEEFLTRFREANWDVLKNKLRNFGIKISVSPKFNERRFDSFHDPEDQRVGELEEKIRGVVLRK